MSSLNKSSFLNFFTSYLPLIILFFSVFNEFDFNYLKLEYFSFNFIFILIFFWTLRNPDYLGYFSIFLAGIVNDVVIGIPIGITVEGANILTRTLIIFGQGLIRCHPHIKGMVDGIENVISKTEILSSEKTDQVTIRLKNMIHIDKSADTFVILKPGYLYRNPYGTGHGSPYDYDAHVPLLFAKEGRVKNHSSIHAETVDIVPTILDILNIKTDIAFDGKVLQIK